MKHNIKSFILVSLFIFSGIAFLSGCNTVKGMGQDVQQGGKALQHAAADSQN